MALTVGANSVFVQTCEGFVGMLHSGGSSSFVFVHELMCSHFLLSRDGVLKVLFFTFIADADAERFIPLLLNCKAPEPKNGQMYNFFSKFFLKLCPVLKQNLHNCTEVRTQKTEKTE